MYNTCPYFYNSKMHSLLPCNMCNMYECPYFTNMKNYNTINARQSTEDEKLNDFVLTLKKRGFTIQEGKLSYVDILKLCSEGKVDSCLANNVGAPYAVCFLPPAPGQNPSVGQESPTSNESQNANNYPANIDFIAPGFASKLRHDEAVVLIGETPPPAIYYCFRSYVSFIQNRAGKDYSNYVTAGNSEIGFYHMVFASLGDQLNNYNIATNSTPDGVPGNPYNSSTVIISTADKNINNQIRIALGIAGYKNDIINNDNIPDELVNMGLEAGKDTFTFMMRMALWENQETGNDYINNINKYLRVFRITPDKPIKNSDPWPVPYLKIRETGITEYQVVPNSRRDYNHLREGIIKKYGSEDFDFLDLDKSIAIPDNFDAILQDINVYGDDRDAVYFKTADFKLKSDDDFIILYGVNHERTGKAIYSNESFYGAEYYNGVVGAFSTAQFPDTATEYFPKGYEASKYYYVFKMARKADGDNTVIIPYSTGNPLGKAYGVDNNKDARIVFRVYLDKIAMVGPYIFDIIWDGAILFTKKQK